MRSERAWAMHQRTEQRADAEGLATFQLHGEESKSEVVRMKHDKQGTGGEGSSAGNNIEDGDSLPPMRP